jgi:hypothetical protein
VIFPAALSPAFYMLAANYSLNYSMYYSVEVFFMGPAKFTSYAHELFFMAPPLPQ